MIKVNNKIGEKYLFNRYKYYIERQMAYKNSGAVNHWEVINELQVLLNELFNYDFPHANGEYYAIRDEEIVYEYKYE